MTQQKAAAAAVKNEEAQRLDRQNSLQFRKSVANEHAAIMREKVSAVCCVLTSLSLSLSVSHTHPYLKQQALIESQEAKEAVGKIKREVLRKKQLAAKSRLQHEVTAKVKVSYIHTYIHSFIHSFIYSLQIQLLYIYIYASFSIILTIQNNS